VALLAFGDFFDEIFAARDFRCRWRFRGSLLQACGGNSQKAGGESNDGEAGSRRDIHGSFSLSVVRRRSSLFQTKRLYEISFLQIVGLLGN
jgi:hypothetical protein